MSSVEVEIYGRKYKLKGDDVQKIRLIADKLSQLLTELGEQYDLDFNKLLLLCSLQLQEKVIELGKTNQELKDELERMNQMISAFVHEPNQ
ncbi:MAG: cell division protein ZapA [Candidatus Cloacimonetes bacterium]|nr:cell division protein ZapA [Candidatus Cloacimonadota bacterium]